MISGRMGKFINCAVIGVGNMGRHHARVYSQLKSARLVAVADTDKTVGKTIANLYDCSFYKNHIDMIKQEKIDALSIATPIKTHYRIAKDCIKFGKHVLIEKPISLTIKEALELIKQAKKQEVKLTVGYIERFNPAVIKLKQMIKRSKLGKLKSLMFQRVGLFPPKNPGTNVVIDMGIHDIDVANFLLDRLPKKVTAIGGKSTLTKEEDYADILLDYGSVAVHIQVNWITPVKIRKLMVVGTKGYVELDYINQSLSFYQHQQPRKYVDFKELVSKFDKESIKTAVKINKKEPLKEELSSFLRAVRLDCQPKVTGKDALPALKIALKISKMIK